MIEKTLLSFFLNDIIIWDEDKIDTLWPQTSPSHSKCINYAGHEHIIASSRLICQNLAIEAGKSIYQFKSSCGSSDRCKQKNCLFDFEPEDCNPLIINTTWSWAVYTNPECNLLFCFFSIWSKKQCSCKSHFKNLDIFVPTFAMLMFFNFFFTVFVNFIVRTLETLNLTVWGREEALKLTNRKKFDIPNEKKYLKTLQTFFSKDLLFLFTKKHVWTHKNTWDVGIWQKSLLSKVALPSWTYLNHSPKNSN